MEAVVLLALLLLLDVAALRWSHDSRPGMHSAEERLASDGFSWSRPPD